MIEMSSRVYRLISSPCTLTTVLVAPTVYSSGSFSNLEPETSSSSVKTVKDRSELLAIHIFFPTSLTAFDFVCLSLDGV